MDALRNLPTNLAGLTSTTVAAQQLGVTADTVRRHLRRGSLEGVKVMSRWRVLLSDVLQPAIVLPPRLEAPAADGTALHLLLEEVGFLREQLSEANHEREELRQLLAQAQAVVNRLVLGSPVTASAAGTQPAIPPAPAAAMAPEEPPGDSPAALHAQPDAEATQAAPSAEPGARSAPQEDDTAPDLPQLESMILRYLTLGWHLRIKLDGRAELAAPAGGQLLYLEEQPDGRVSAQRFRDPS